MNPALIFKLRPLGPWRSGPENGARDRVDTVFHSDSLYSAVTTAMAALGSLDEWLDATARSESGPAVRFSSCFPFQGDVGYVTPPRGVWPPVVSSKVRWKGARFVPLHVVDALLSGDVLDEDRWSVDGASECLVMSGNRGPFRVAMRSNAAVDRLGQAVVPHATACLEFAAGAGLWGVAAFAGEAEQTRWSPLVQAALRLLGDSGLGGERSRGWGRFEAPEFIKGALPEMLLPRTGLLPAQALVSRIESRLREETYHWAGRDHPLPSVSFGIAWFPEDGRTDDALLAVADQRMYEDKAHSRTRREGALGAD